MKPLRQKRSQRGSLGAVLYAAGMLIVILLSAFGVDTAQATYIRCQLRAVADAAAIAGAQDLTLDPSKCEQHARAVAEENLQKALATAPGASNTQINTQVTPPGPGTLGLVRVTVRTNVNHLLLGLIGRPQDDLQVVAAAGGAGRTLRHSGHKLFPLAVSIDAMPGNGSSNNGNNGGSQTSANTYYDHQPLQNLRVGDLAYFHLNSQTFKNSAWTSFSKKPTSGRWLHDAIDQCLGFEPEVAGHIPCTNVGEEIYLINGIVGEKKLAEPAYLQALRNEPILFLPVITGEEPFSQNRTLIGWIGVHIENVVVNQKGGVVETIVARIEKTTDYGGCGQLPSCGNAQADAALADWNPYSIKLVE